MLLCCSLCRGEGSTVVYCHSEQFILTLFPTVTELSSALLLTHILLLLLAGVKTPYDYKRLGFVTGIKYLDQVEEMVKHNYRREKKSNFLSILLGEEESSEVNSTQQTTEGKEAKESEEEKVDHAADYTLESEFVNNPRRKSSPLLPLAITDLINKTANNTESIISEYIAQDSTLIKKDLKLLNQICTRNIREQNTTEFLKKFEFFLRMRTVFSRNLFYYNSVASAFVPNDGTSTVGNNNDDAIIALNLNNMTAAKNDQFLETSRMLFKAVESITGNYMTLLSREQNRADQEKLSARRDARRSLGTLYPAGLYLRKMRKGSRILAGLPYKEVRGGPRIAVINAVGGIGSGKSGNGVSGKSLGSDTLIAQVTRLSCSYLCFNLISFSCFAIDLSSHCAGDMQRFSAHIADHCNRLEYCDT